ncbi:hypothetical protein VVD49_09395 [Uliginosibacterium sp. H3]|uniref:Uncharacterized protein n=1 Tax=Uliginosibacterium silvisoli TaxID=3114758 RepID=A0ABU6K1Z1_9RHOO|nr:hypothetical protein [Uliginosibacterium sp. H3]
MHKTILVALSLALFVQAALAIEGGAVSTPRAAGYASAFQTDNPLLSSCDWNVALAKELVLQAKGKVVFSTSEKMTGRYMLVEATKVVASGAPGKRTNLIAVRANVFNDGKLIATTDISRDDTVAAATPFCDGLRDIGSELGEDLADWIARVSLPQCDAACPGIHPDEDIAVLPEVPTVHASSINETVIGCGWPTYMVGKVVHEFNDAELAPRGKLKVLGKGASIGSGRRLILSVDNIHVMGGGGWTGPKWINMHGELLDGEMLLGSFDATQRETSPRMTACGALESLSDNMAERIARWLNTPQIASKLQ